MEGGEGGGGAGVRSYLFIFLLFRAWMQSF